MIVIIKVLKLYLRLKDYDENYDALLAKLIETFNTATSLLQSDQNHQLTTQNNNCKNDNFENRFRDSIKRQNKQVEVQTKDIKNAVRIKSNL